MNPLRAIFHAVRRWQLTRQARRPLDIKNLDLDHLAASRRKFLTIHKP